MPGTMEQLRSFEKHNTCFEILKAFYNVNSLESLIDMLNDPTDAFIADSAWNAKVCKAYAIDNLIKNRNEQAEFKIMGVDFNSGWQTTKMTVGGIKYWLDWNLNDE